MVKKAALPFNGIRMAKIRPDMSKCAPLVFIACGALTALPFIVGCTHLISWLALSPAIYLLMRDSASIGKRRAYLLGFCLGIGYFGVMYHWFSYLYPMDFAGLDKLSSIAVIAVCWIGLATLQSLELGFVTLLYKLLSPRQSSPFRACALFTCLWVLYEWQQTLGWRGVPWGRLALSQSDALPLVQSASLLGSSFVSALIVAVNACIAAAVLTARSAPHEQAPERATERQSEQAPEQAPEHTPDEVTAPSTEESGAISHIEAHTYSLKERALSFAIGFFGALRRQRTVRALALTAAGIFTANAIFGALRPMLVDEKDGESLTAAVIQGNISSTDKWADEEDDALQAFSDIYVTLTRECVAETGAQLVVWPETVIPAEIDGAYYLKSAYKKLSAELGIVLAVGTFDDVYEPESGQICEYNALVFFMPDGTESEVRYYKRRLVPFGESLPLEGFIKTFLPILLELNLVSEPLTQGTDAAVLDTPIGRLGSLICFDSIYPSLTLDTVRDGAQLIVLATNDSWFSDSAAVYQHNDQAALRAIESGRYVVRAANTGISSVITPLGEVLTELPPLVSGYTAATVYTRDALTVYDRVGDIFVYVCIAYAALELFLYIGRRTRQKRRVSSDASDPAHGEM